MKELGGLRLRSIEEVVIASNVMIIIRDISKAKGDHVSEIQANKILEVFAWLTRHPDGEGFACVIEPLMRQWRAQNQ